jgi:hypothetical protein
MPAAIWWATARLKYWKRTAFKVGGTAIPVPQSIFVGLYTDPSIEVSAAEYARQPVTLADNGANLLYNSATLIFPAPTSDWGVITHAHIIVGEPDGFFYPWWGCEIGNNAGDATGQEVNNTLGVPFFIPAGKIKITI